MDARPAPAYEELLEFLYLTPVGIIKFRPDGQIELANPMAAQLLMPLSEDGDLSDLYVLLAAVAPDLRASVERFLPTAGPICDDRRLVVLCARKILTLTINKINTGTLMAVIRDITRTVEQEVRIFDDQQRFRAIFDNIRDYAIYTVSLDGRVEEWNRTLSRIGGWEPADVTGAPISIFFPPGQAGKPQSSALLEHALQYGSAEFEGWRVRKDGSRFWGDSAATILPDREDKATGFVIITRDLTERKLREDGLVAQATTDPLTGALIRRAGEARLDDLFSRLQRSGQTFAVLMIDCDHFKAVNDRWGHSGGDKVLVSLVEICRDRLRDGDAVIRWGGEEFVLLLPNAHGENAVLVAERLRQSVEVATIEYNGNTIPVTISIGVATADKADVRAEEVVQRADEAMYRAKHAGRNQVAETTVTIFVTVSAPLRSDPHPPLCYSRGS